MPQRFAENRTQIKNRTQVRTSHYMWSLLLMFHVFCRMMGVFYASIFMRATELSRFAQST